MKECKHCCGDCCWFKHEDTDGISMCCIDDGYDYIYGDTKCSDPLCKEYVSEQEMRHHIAVLMLHNRWRRSNEPTGFYKMQDPKEIGLAIDFAIKYIKTFMEL